MVQKYEDDDNFSNEKKITHPNKQSHTTKDMDIYKSEYDLWFNYEYYELTMNTNAFLEILQSLKRLFFLP